MAGSDLDPRTMDFEEKRYESQWSAMLDVNGWLHDFYNDWYSAEVDRPENATYPAWKLRVMGFLRDRGTGFFAHDWISIAVALRALIIREFNFKGRRKLDLLGDGLR